MIKRKAIINESGLVENVILCREDFSVGPGKILIDARDGIGPDWSFDGQDFAPPPPPPPPPDPVVSDTEARLMALENRIGKLTTQEIETARAAILKAKIDAAKA